MSELDDVLRMADDPSEFFGGSGRASHHVPRRDIEEWQRVGLQARFADLRDRLPVLQSIAAELGVDRIDTLQDGARLLFPHTVYKSYPVALLEKNRFDQLTRWLGRLTTTDLSKVDLSTSRDIDSWLDALEEQTDVRVVHSSGTSGTMSFLPCSSRVVRLRGDVFAMATRDFNDLEGRDLAKEQWQCAFMGFRSGRSHAGRSTQWVIDHFAGSEANFHALYDVNMSSDVMFMAARVRRAEARGELDRLEVSPHLKARQAEFEAVQRDAANAVDRMFEKLISFKGQPTYIAGMTATLTDLAQRGLDRGLRNLYGSDCIVQTGGGAKGVVLPENWAETLLEFTGGKRIGHYYGMTEVTMTCPKCSHGHYHVPPWVITYVLDPETGAPLPRDGVHTGRAAFFDLTPTTYWGGFATGDEITVDWNPCPCGRTTDHIHPTIQRFSEQQGGDDKITCAAAEEAHAAALDFLTQNR